MAETITLEYWAGPVFKFVINDARRIMKILSCNARVDMNGVSVHIFGEETPVDLAAKMLNCAIKKR